MNVKQRILAIKLLEQKQNHRQFITKIGLTVNMKPLPVKDNSK